MHLCTTYRNLANDGDVQKSINRTISRHTWCHVHFQENFPCFWNISTQNRQLVRLLREGMLGNLFMLSSTGNLRGSEGVKRRRAECELEEDNGCERRNGERTESSPALINFKEQDSSTH